MASIVKDIVIRNAIHQKQFPSNITDLNILSDIKFVVKCIRWWALYLLYVAKYIPTHTLTSKAHEITF